ncbi:hypothetical protein [Intrasporangium calvum]|uniref:hypothetical protein n=1 Tax=Intrasporangium calvum TaxID=53358 RepID=UPI0011D1BF93|nr:hypothetical protein [Intrasporangium calvum]
MAIPERFDSRPLFDELWLDYTLDNVMPDRLAVAAALTFRQGLTKSFKVPDPIFTVTASAIEDLASSRDLRVNQVVPGELSRSRGNAVLVVNVDNPSATVVNTRGGRRHIAFNILRSDRFAGALLAMDSLSLASNAWLHQRHPSSPLEAHLPYLAVAVLTAEDLGAGAIALMTDVLESDRALAKKVRRLCNAVGLSLLSSSHDGD